MINKLVPISNALTWLAEDTDPEVLNMKPILLRWATAGDQKIGSQYSYETAYYVLNINDRAAEIPLAAVHLKNMIFGDYLDRCPDIFNSIQTINETEGIYEGRSIIWKWSDNNVAPQCFSTPWSIENNKIVFHSTFSATKITVKVWQYNVDSEGIPLVNENHIEAIAAYLQGKLAMKQRWNRFKKGKFTSADRAMIADVKNEFVQLARLARVDDEQTNDMDMKDVGNIITNPYTGSSGLNLVGYY